MKSINEKAKEVQIGYDDIQAPAIGTGFVTGANYVLECLERAIDRNESTFVYCREKYIQVQVLSELVEKLKCNNYGKKRGNRGH